MVVCALVTAWLWGRVGSLSLLPLVVLVHFFLFCNVFRVRTRYELIWAASFVLNAGAWQLMGELGWQSLLGAQIPITLLVFAIRARAAPRPP